MPPQKPTDEGQVDMHGSFVPCSTPLAFAANDVVCYVVGSNVHLLNIKTGTKDVIHTSVFGITKLAANPVKGLVAICEGGVSPSIYIYRVEDKECHFVLKDVTELELADLAFSRCGARLYTLSRATGKYLKAFLMATGKEMPGCMIELPSRFDKVCVFPGHKDFMALVRSSTIRMVSLQKSYKTYIMRLHPSSISPDADFSVSAYAWAPTGYFLFATRQGFLCTLDGTNGALLHTCQVAQPITSIGVSRSHLVTAHIGNAMKFWNHKPQNMGSKESVDGTLLAGPPMEIEETAQKKAVYELERVADIEQFSLDRRKDAALAGQVVHVQATPDLLSGVLVTAEGEVWSFQLPPDPAYAAKERAHEKMKRRSSSGLADMPEGEQLPESHQDEEEEELQLEVSEPDVPLREEEMDLKLITWFHTHPVTDISFLGRAARLCVSSDESGRLRIWDAVNKQLAKGFCMLKFGSGVTSLTCSEDGNLVVCATDAGSLHVIDTTNWRRPKVVDTLRISEAGVMKLCSITYGTRCLSGAALMFDNSIAFFTVMFAEPKISMAGFVELGAAIEDICFHDKDFNAQSLNPARLLCVGCYCPPSGTEPWPAFWSVKSPPLGYEPKSTELKRDVCPIWSMRLSSEHKKGDKPTVVAPAAKRSVVIGFADGGLKIFPVPANSGPPSAKQVVGKPQEVLQSMGQLVTCLRVSGDGAWLVSGSMSGAIRRTPMEGEIKSSLQKSLHNPYNNGVAQVCLSDDNVVLLSTGGSDGLFVWSSSTGVDLAEEVIETGDDFAEDSVDELEEQHWQEEALQQDPSLLPVWVPIADTDLAMAAGDAEDPELVAQAALQRRAIMQEVEGLRKKLRVIVDANAHCPDLEKLDRSEFCIDFEERDSIAGKTKERCDVLRAQIEKENLARQLIRDRLIKEFWSPMRTKGCQIVSLMTNFAVSNYPERIVSDEEKSDLMKIRLLRQSELLEQQMLQSPECPPALRGDIILDADNFTTGDEEYVLNWWPKKVPGKSARPRGSAKEDAGDASPKKEEKKAEAVNSQSDQRLLYEPFELLTNYRRRLQIFLLQALAAEFRAAFNEQFALAQGEKKDTIGNIKEKINRIRAILAELGIVEDVPEPVPNDLEVPEAVLEVKDSELQAEKWISPEEKKRVAAAEAAEVERLRLLRENDAGQRALKDMMGGTLKTKKDLSALEIVLDREPWMDEIEFDDMTDAQQAAFREFEMKEKALAEEQDKYRKQLDAELKKLRQEVQEIMVTYEGTLKELHHKRFSHDMRFFCQELYCVRLQLALLQTVEDQNVLDKMLKDVGEAKDKLMNAESKLGSFQEEVNATTEKQQERVRHEREIASAQYFKQQFANSGLEPEAVSQLLQIYRKKKEGGARTVERPSENLITRPSLNASTSGLHGHGSTGTKVRRSLGSNQVSPAPEGDAMRFGAPNMCMTNATMTAAGSRGSFSDNDPYNKIAVGDPYPDLGVASRKDSFEEKNEHEPPGECPEGVDDASFQRMLQLWHERTQAEHEVHKGNAVLHEMSGLLSHLQRERDEAKGVHDRLEQELKDHRELMERELYDIEILFKLKQGQVEVPQAAVVTDYSDAIVIDQEVVESRNRRILELGKDKVGTLHTIKEFRKRLNLIQWEHKMLALNTLDLEERAKDVHMLRVTKGLQTLLKGGEEGRNKADADLLERKIEHLSSTTAQKEGSLKKQYGMASHACKMRKNENSMLDKKLRELQNNVIQREHIRRLRAPQGGGAGGGGKQRGEKPRITGGGGKIEENDGETKAAQSNFREVRTRQFLMDTAKKHTEEIDVLRKELDRLRQKTFPSFVQLHEDRPDNPDHA